MSRKNRNKRYKSVPTKNIVVGGQNAQIQGSRVAPDGRILKDNENLIEPQRVFAPAGTKDRIAVLINARNAHHVIGGTIIGAMQMAKDRDLLHFGVRVDEDDDKTISVLKEIQAASQVPLDIFVGPRPIFQGAELTHMAREIDAEFYTVLNDDTPIMSWEWDNLIRLCHKDKPQFLVGAWSSYPPHPVTMPNGTQELAYPADYQIFRKEWIKANENVLFAGWFPYWWEDFMVVQTWRYVTGLNLPIFPVCLCGVKLGPTKNLRDFDFWKSYYKMLEPWRLGIAKNIAEKLGQQHHITKEMVDIGRIHIEQAFDPQRVAQINKILTDHSEPSPQYKEAKAIALRNMSVLVQQSEYSAHIYNTEIVAKNPDLELSPYVPNLPLPINTPAIVPLQIHTAKEPAPVESLGQAMSEKLD